jgi:hypothetical protein
VAPRLLPVAVTIRPLRRFVFRAASQLDISYRRWRLLPRRPPIEGDRLPDVRVRREGRDGWLSESLTPAGFHLLVFGPTDRSVPSSLTDRYERLSVLCIGEGPRIEIDRTGLRALGVRGPTQLLVRPDGHVAFRRHGSPSELEALVAGWVGPPRGREPGRLP